MSLTNQHHHHRFAVARSIPTKHRTLCDLPVELLRMIIVPHVKRDRRTLRACTLVCRCLRAVAIEHLFPRQWSSLRVSEIASFDHLTSFLQKNPAVCKKVRTLILQGHTRQAEDSKTGDVTRVPLTPLDDTIVARLLWLLPNLTTFHLRFFDYKLPPNMASQTQEDARGPFHVKYLRFAAWGEETHKKSSIPGLFRILSLFSIEELSAEHIGGMFDTSESLDPAVLHRSVGIKKLTLGPRGDGPGSPDQSKCTLQLLDALAASIEPDSLQSLTARCSSTDVVAAIGNVFARGGAELTNLEIQWRRTTLRHWHTLNLTSCPKLESLSLRIYFRALCNKPQPPDVPILSLAGAGTLSQASHTLREVSILLDDLPSVPTLDHKKPLRLHKFDKIITAERFPLLEKVYLQIKPCYELTMKPRYAWKSVENVLRNVLPSLHSRGLLKVYPVWVVE